MSRTASVCELQLLSGYKKQYLFTIRSQISKLHDPGCQSSGGQCTMARGALDHREDTADGWSQLLGNPGDLLSLGFVVQLVHGIDEDDGGWGVRIAEGCEDTLCGVFEVWRKVILLQTEKRTFAYHVAFRNPLHNGLIHRPPGDVVLNLKVQSLILLYGLHQYILWSCHQEQHLWNNTTQHLWNKSTLVQVMVRCRQGKSHYLTQCWPRSMSP